MEVCMNQSLAFGAELNADTFADFVKRLHHDCVGEGVNDHYTADALFIVQEKVIIQGIDKEYVDDWCVYHDERTWYSPVDYWKSLDKSDKADLNKICKESWGETFLKLNSLLQWDVLSGLDEHIVSGYAERWEYVCAHFTKDAAEAFIARKKHDYRDGLRVYVDSQYWAWEFNAIKNALINGKLVFKA
jgi:hypothetical protein